MTNPVSGSANRLADLPVYTPPGNNSNNNVAVGESNGSSPTTPATSATSSGVQATGQLNQSIIQSQLNLTAQNDPLALVLKSAITGINEALAPTLGENALQNAASQDNSPEATAGRIVSLSTGFFQAFKQQHPDLSEDDAASKFLDTIKGGIERGFKEARDILGGLKVLNGDVASNVDKTYDLVQQGLNQFASDHGLATTPPPVKDGAGGKDGGVGNGNSNGGGTTTTTSTTQVNIQVSSSTRVTSNFRAQA
jgi:hypothetical protein